jgi:hypothetical protein
MACGGHERASPDDTPAGGARQWRTMFSRPSRTIHVATAHAAPSPDRPAREPTAMTAPDDRATPRATTPTSPAGEPARRPSYAFDPIRVVALAAVLGDQGRRRDEEVVETWR